MIRRPPFPRQMYVLLACSFSVALGYGILAPVLPVIAKSYGVNFAASGLVVSAFALARLVFATTAARLVTARGEALIYMAGLLIVAASTLGAAFAPSFPFLILLRGLGGIGSTMFTIAATGLLIRITPPEIRGRASAAFGGSFLLGNIIGPSLGGLVAEWGMRMPFFIYTGTLLVAAGIMAVSLLRERRRLLAAPAEKKPETAGMRFAEAFRDRRYKTLVTSSFANGLAVFGMRVAMLPLLAGYVATHPRMGWDPMDGLSPSRLTGLAMTAFALGTICMLPFSGRIVDTRGRSGPGFIGMLGIAATFALIGWAPNGTLLVIASLLGGVSEAIQSPAVQATLADVVGPRRGGSAIAAPQMAADVGAILGPIVGGAVADAAGFGWAFTAIVTVPLVAAMMWLRLYRRPVEPALGV